MIDWGRVETLRSEIGASDFCEVVQLFLEEVEEIISRLRSNPEPDRYEADLHFLKGSALNLGFKRLGALCQEGEKRAAAGDAASVDIRAILSLYQASKQEFMLRANPMCRCITAA